MIDMAHPIEQNKPKIDIAAKLISLVGIDKETVTQAKQLLGMVKLILPKCEFRTVQTDENTEYAAVLFEHTPENMRRVQAIEEVFTDILPPFLALTDFTLEDETGNTTYAALLFEIPAKEQTKP